ncbi:MAG: hypothetical protein ACI8PZ_007549, partial [Myxococcota bacterium]
MLGMVACEESDGGLKSFEDTDPVSVTTTPAGTTPGGTTPLGVEDCLNGLDDDGDGRPDCFDEDCESVCDADGDGEDGEAYGGEDCDDTNPDINTEAPERCNGLDDDCDGLLDDGDPDLSPGDLLEWFSDVDEDGFGDPNVSVRRCAEPPASTLDDTDCDDTDPAVNPDGEEICNGIDDDCDGLLDDADPDTDLTMAPWWYLDLDGDGFGVPEGSVQSCGLPDGGPWSLESTDCDDADPDLGPPTDWWPDADLDGFGAGDALGVEECVSPVEGYVAVWRGVDCDDERPEVNPGAEDICEDGVDQDCDGEDAGCARYLYAATGGEGPYRLYQIDVDTGIVTLVGDTGVSLTSLDFLPDGTAFAIGGGGIGYGRAEAGQIYTVNLATAEVTPWFSAPGGIQEGAIAFVDGHLWKVDQFDDLFRIDPDTLLGDSLGFTAEPLAGYAKDFAATADGRLFYGGNAEIYEVDLVTGEFTFAVAGSGLPGSNSGGALTFHGGEMWAIISDGVTSGLATVDLVSGFA